MAGDGSFTCFSASEKGFYFEMTAFESRVKLQTNLKNFPSEYVYQFFSDEKPLK